MLNPGDVDWPTLTRSPEKQRAYAEDLYFREGWDDVTSVVGSDLPQVLRRTAILSLKPDAVAGRRGEAVLAFLVDHGFRPFDAWAITLHRHAQRAMWQFDWHVYTPDRLEFSTCWYSTAPMVVIALEDSESRPGGLPASVRLSTLKGSADPGARTPDQLRSVLRTPNRVLNFVHVTDEPADLVRELAIYAPTRDRRAMAAALADGVHGGGDLGRVQAVLRSAEAEVPAHDLDVHASLDRLERSGHAPAGLRQVVAEGALAPRPLLTRLLEGDGDRWDVITVASSVVEYERPGLTGLLPGPDVAAWTRPI